MDISGSGSLTNESEIQLTDNNSVLPSTDVLGETHHDTSSQLIHKTSEEKDGQGYDENGGVERREPVKSDFPQRGWKRYLGVIYAFCAVQASSLGSNIFKLLIDEGINPITLLLYSFPIGILLSAPFIFHRGYIQKKPLMENVSSNSCGQLSKVIFFMWLRSMCAVFITVTFMLSIDYILVSDSRTIFSASVIVVNIFGFILFNEKLGIVTAIISVITLVGIVVMSKPPVLTGEEEFNQKTLIGIAYAICSMLCSAGHMLVLRFLHGIYHGLHNTFLFIWAFIFTLPFAIVFDTFVVPQCTALKVLGIILLGVLQSFINTSLALAIEIETVGVVALVRTCELIFVFMWQMILFNVFPDWISCIGAVLVLSGVFVVGLKKWLEGKDESSPIRMKLKWLLI